jgi:hypothetical protein
MATLLANNLLEKRLIECLVVWLASQVSDPVASQITWMASDSTPTRSNMPYAIVHCGNLEEEIVPQSGIFKADVTVDFFSHTKNDISGLTQDQRDNVAQAIQSFFYESPERVLSTTGLTVYKCLPAGVVIDVEIEQKAYVYTVSTNIVFTPTS